MKNGKQTQVKKEVGFKQIREVKPSRTTYSRVKRYLSKEQETRDLGMADAAVELIEAGLEVKGIV